jgi:hypothetical protein
MRNQKKHLKNHPQRHYWNRNKKKFLLNKKMSHIFQLMKKIQQIQQKGVQQRAQKGDFGALLGGGRALDLGNVDDAQATKNIQKTAKKQAKKEQKRREYIAFLSENQKLHRYSNGDLQKLTYEDLQKLVKSIKAKLKRMMDKQISADLTTFLDQQGYKDF